MAKIHKIHDNDARDEYVAKIAKLDDLASGAKFLTEFRKANMSPFRTSYALDLDCNWIETQIEDRVAVLRSRAAKTNDCLFNKCANGEDAAVVVKKVVDAMNACTDKWEAEKIHINFRLEYKTPIMPTNYFMDTDRILGTKLMELRNTGYYDTSLEDLRKQRGVKVIKLVDANAL
ncbi:MAG: methane monooxygenase [Methylophilaceae bacterium]|nr:methane monooxygenase [Methylophilaceae bacterium]